MVTANLAVSVGNEFKFLLNHHSKTAVVYVVLHDNTIAILPLTFITCLVLLIARFNSIRLNNEFVAIR